MMEIPRPAGRRVWPNTFRPLTRWLRRIRQRQRMEALRRQPQLARDVGLGPLAEPPPQPRDLNERGW